MTNLLIEAAVRATVVLAAAWMASVILRRASADLRHRIWLAALVCVALSLIPAPVPEPWRLEIDVPGASNAALAAASEGRPATLSIWAAVALVLLARLAIGLAKLAQWTHAARSAAGKNARSDARSKGQSGAANKLQSDAGILFSDSVPTPMTWGALLPVILLPAYMSEWTEEKRAAVVLHEQAHVARRDWLWQTFAQVVTAVFWFHPLVWLAAARLRDEADRAADDRVLAKGVGAAEYADRLLEVARRLRGSVPQASVAMGREPVLSARIGAILDPVRSRTQAGWRHWATIATASAFLLLSVAAAESPRIYKVAEVTTPPRVASKVEPKYTAQARAANLQGTVVLTMVIKPNGRADHINVSRSLDKGLDANAVAAIRKWHFDPGELDGKAVPVAATIEVNFKLR